MIEIINPEGHLGVERALFYQLKGLNPTQSYEVEVYSDQSKELLGVKRVVRSESSRINVANYFKGEVGAEPKLWEPFRPTVAEGRFTYCYIEVEGEASTPVLISCGVGGAEGDKVLLMGRNTLQGELSVGEFVELSLLMPSSEKLLLKLRGERKNGTSVEHTLPNYYATKGVNALLVDHNKAVELLGGGEFERVSVSVEGESFSLEQSFKLVNRAEGAVRLCWINQLGGIDYYTFLPQQRALLQPTGKSVNIDGVTTHLSQGIAQKRSLCSNYERREVVEWLSEILSSPSVWRVEESGSETTFLPVVVEGKGVEMEQGRPSLLKLDYLERGEV